MERLQASPYQFSPLQEAEANDSCFWSSDGISKQFLEFVRKDRADANKALLSEVMNLVRVHVPHMANRSFLNDPEDVEEFHGTNLAEAFDVQLP